MVNGVKKYVDSEMLWKPESMFLGGTDFQGKACENKSDLKKQWTLVRHLEYVRLNEQMFRGWWGMCFHEMYGRAWDKSRMPGGAEGYCYSFVPEFMMKVGTKRL